MSKSNGRSLVEDSKRFAMALNHALYDKEREAEAPLVFLYDADVLVQSMLGLTGWQKDEPVPSNIASSDFVVRALFSMGYLPKAHLLRPHLVEIDRYIQNARKPEKQERNSRIRQLQILIRSWALDQHERRMQEYALNMAALENLIRSEGFEIFVKLELCYGGLLIDRVGRVLRNCVLVDKALPSYVLHPGDEFAYEVADIVGTSPVRRKRGLNNLVDGYALSELTRHVESGAPVRFYTETEPVRNVCRDRLPPDSRGRSVVRDAEYFLMRCSFPALGFAHLQISRDAPHDPASHTTEKLAEMNDRLQELLAPDEIEPEELEEVLRQEKLADLIEDFYSLKFLKNVFLRWEMSKELEKSLPYMANFFNNEPHVARMHEALEQSLSAVTDELSKELDQLTRWQEDVRQLSTTIRARRNDFQEVAPDPWKDLGLGRWGLNEFLPSSLAAALTRWLVDVADPEKPVTYLASDLALRIAPEGYRDWSDFALSQCQLWCLKLYGRLVTEWEESSSRFEDRAGAHILQVLYLVARIKTIPSPIQNAPKVEITRVYSIVEETERRMVAPSELQDAGVTAACDMGVAHVAYWAWKRLSWLDAGPAEEMIEKSFAAARRALDRFNPGSLAYAFALNHCVYVGTVGRIQSDETERLRHLSFNLPTEFRNHYRFADTRARQLTEELIQHLKENSLQQVLKDREPEGLQDLLCTLVAEAKGILHDARPFFGDEEVETHWRELVGFEGSLQCRARRTRTRASWR